MLGNRIAAMFPSGHLFDTPCIPNLVVHIAKQGIDVDLYSAFNSATPTGDFKNHGNVWHHLFPWTQRRAKENIAILSIVFFIWSWYKLSKKDNQILLAVGVRGLILVGFLAIFLRKKYIYYSLEIYDQEHRGGFLFKLFKWLEIYFHKKAVATVIQDDVRGALISDLNRVERESVLVFPNAPYGDTDCEDNQELSAKIFEKVNLSDTKLILASGSLSAKWAGIESLILVASEFPENCLFFLQSRQDVRKTLKFDVDDKKVFVSTSPLSVEQYNSLVCESHVCIAIYESSDRNIQYVGLSSGKLAHYLSCGKPIIVNRIPLWADLVDKYKCGVVVDDYSEIPNAIQRINFEYDLYVEGAKKVYAEYFNMDEYASNIASEISKLMRYS